MAGPAGRPDLGEALLRRGAPRWRRRGRPACPVRARQPVQPARAAPQRRGPRDDAPLGAVEPARLDHLPRTPTALCRRVRLAGSARVGDDDPLDQRRAAHPGVARDDRAPEGRRGEHEARHRPRAALSRAGRDPRLALGDAAEPGRRRRHGTGMVPVAEPAQRRRGRLAAQRLLARHLVGGHRRRRAGEAPPVRDEEGVRAEGLDRSARRRWARRGGVQRQRRHLERHAGAAPPALRRDHPGGAGPPGR